MATFFKAGAPPTYIRRRGEVERVAQSSLPVGILNNIKLSKSSVRLSKGDVIVVLSDGALFGDDSWLVSAIRDYPGKHPRAFARDIVQTAKNLRHDGHEDDITVMAAVIT